MRTIISFIYLVSLLLLFAGSALAQNDIHRTAGKFDTVAVRTLQDEATDDICPKESAAADACGLNTKCSLCQAVALATAGGVTADDKIDVSDGSRVQEVCDALRKSSYCADLNRCISEVCPDDCSKLAMRALSNCLLKEGGCEMDPFGECSGGFINTKATAAAWIFAAVVGWII